MSQLMMRMKRWLPLIFAVVMGLLAVGLINRYLSEQLRALEQERKKIMAAYQAPVDIVVAGVDVPEGTQLDESHLKIMTVPERFVQPYATGNPHEVLGKIAVAQLAAGEQIMLNKLRREEEVPAGATLSRLTPKGKRAVTIAVDTLAGVGGFVRPGDLIDVLLSLQVPIAGQQEPGQVTLTLFQDVPVLAIGAETSALSKDKTQATAPPAP